MAKYTYRFHYRSRVDITVDADNEDDASMIAQDRYNNGEYEDDPEPQTAEEIIKNLVAEHSLA